MSYHHYHPYRFSKFAEALSRRVSLTASQSNRAALMKTEYAGIDGEEFHARMDEYRRLIDTHAKWAATGRQIFDMSATLSPLAGAEDIGISALPALRLPDVFYVHFGNEAAIVLSETTDVFVDGVYFLHTEEAGEPGYRFTIVCGADDLAIETATAGELLRIQSRIASGFASPTRPFRAGMDKLTGDPVLCQDGALEQVLDRIELSLAYAADPGAVPDLDKEVHLGARTQLGPRH
jgi:hypothetical protein